MKFLYDEEKEKKDCKNLEISFTIKTNFIGRSKQAFDCGKK